jgi:hypothetical protein
VIRSRLPVILASLGADVLMHQDTPSRRTLSSQSVAGWVRTTYTASAAPVICGQLKSRRSAVRVMAMNGADEVHAPGESRATTPSSLAQRDVNLRNPGIVT